MSDELETPEEKLYTGTHGQYYWIISTHDDYSGTLVRLCPEIFIGRYMAVTAIDSGVPWLTDRQEAAKWTIRRKIVYSPLLKSVDDIFYQRDGYDVPGYDEWYLFQTEPDLGEIQKDNPFDEATAPRPGRPMNFAGMSSANVHYTDPRCEIVREMFWKQLDWIRSESYISDSSDCLTFVTHNRKLFDLVFDRLSRVHAG